MPSKTLRLDASLPLRVRFTATYIPLDRVKLNQTSFPPAPFTMAGTLWPGFYRVLWFVLPCLAQTPSDPLFFCRRYGHQTAVIDRKLYIDGGWWYGNPISQYPIPTMSECHFSVRDYANPADQYLSYDDLDVVSEGMPKQYANLTKNSSIPDVAGGVLWQDEVNKVFWLYGGEFSEAPSSFELWGYDVIMNQWNKTSASNSQIQRVSYGAGVASSKAGTGFYYGGYLNNLTNPSWTGPPVATSSLLVFDMDTGIITNNTGFNETGIAEGVMVYIPASSSGLLVYFGGVSYPYGNDTEVPVSWRPSFTDRLTFSGTPGYHFHLRSWGW
jgi:hypothetical protein